MQTALRDLHSGAVLDAMAVGRSVLSFSDDGVAETVDDGLTGPGLAALRVLVADGLSGTMNTAALERGWGPFSAERTAHHVMAVMKDVFAHG